MILANLKTAFFRAHATQADKIFRRGRAKTVAALLAAFATLAPNALESAAANGDTRTLFLYHSHSKESLAATFRVNGHYDAATLEKLNWFLRDWRNDEPTQMDPKLFDVLWEAYRSADRMGPEDPIVVVSAYRCPSTNAMLRQRSRAVAKNSQHMLGKAMDTTIPGLSMARIREVGMRMQRGGVGYYPNAGTPFVHLDVGGVRHWPRMTYEQLAQLFPDGKTVHIPSNGKLLPGYEEARADILARGGEAISVAEAQSSGGLRGFFAALFGGDDEEEARQVASVKPTRVAGRNARRQVADGGEDEEGAQLEPQRRIMAKAETNLPRGETFMGAPPEVSPAPAPAAAPPPAPVQPARLEQTAPDARPEPAKPQPIEEEANAGNDDQPHPLDNAPLPPRRPAALEDLVADAPTPPPRPIDLAALPAVITHGGGGATRTARPGDASAPLAYATQSRPQDSAAAPLPPPRPSLQALRPAAAAKAEQTRADRASPMAPARVDRAALTPMLAPTARGGGAAAAPALRAAAKVDPLVAAPVAGAPARFGARPDTLDHRTFSRTQD
ncbi:uncharacterized protein YcbK (DUF882 family) [Rhodoblastus acidophilus]|uniref:DUF882 domain-containing protein n=1 Tax=Rhodoblastus acidophilus TaxID=1074 RepID=UPI001FEE1BE0|nr:DUF882 domain-containing protein [Rhodoblastus acidophilus]MCW2273252.1 uncharacterized protein YcbK (DUF882 family) [Rhodoblastus acidophilus]